MATRTMNPTGLSKDQIFEINAFGESRELKVVWAVYGWKEGKRSRVLLGVFWMEGDADLCASSYRQGKEIPRAYCLDHVRTYQHRVTETDWEAIKVAPACEPSRAEVVNRLNLLDTADRLALFLEATDTDTQETAAAIRRFHTLSHEDVTKVLLDERPRA